MILHLNPKRHKQQLKSDERFTKNIDGFGDGLAKFMSRAMAVFAVITKSDLTCKYEPKPNIWSWLIFSVV